jgi:hypothetical protein
MGLLSGQRTGSGAEDRGRLTTSPPRERDPPPCSLTGSLHWALTSLLLILLVLLSIKVLVMEEEGRVARVGVEEDLRSLREQMDFLLSSKLVSGSSLSSSSSSNNGGSGGSFRSSVSPELNATQNFLRVKRDLVDNAICSCPMGEYL